jgi:N-acetylmuramate 1-kinase
MTDKASRRSAIEQFVAEQGLAQARRTPLADDASFRRYFRIAEAQRTLILMDAPPPQEDVRPFAHVARLLRQLGLSAPEILAEDPANGFLLLEDLGDTTYARLLAAGADEQQLYELAVDALVALHRRFDPAARHGLPELTQSRAIQEAKRPLEWMWPQLRGAPPAPSIVAEFEDAWAEAWPAARAVPQTLVHFDFHIDNLLRLDSRTGVAACGLLDFQDAVLGPLPFDLVSLIEDVRRDVPAALGQSLIERYLRACPAVGRAEFLAAYSVSGAQRNTRILGNFARLAVRDKKPGYLRFMPRVWRLLDGDLAHPALASLKRWFDRYLPAGAREFPNSFAAQ